MYSTPLSAKTLLHPHKYAISKIFLMRMDSASRNNIKLEDKLKFDNKALRSLPLDKIEKNFIRTVNNAIYSLVKPTPLKNPKLVAFSKSALQLIDLDENDVAEKDFVLLFSGSKLFNGSQTASQCYAGHQFGSYVGQLGDGAVCYLGEVINSKNQRYELQLKGSGLTPYSRTADGRKVLRSSIREFLCSEAMYYLGVPTTRAATCITSDDYVIRDIFYDGNEVKEQCAVVSRIAESFIRFGTFEIFKTRDDLTGIGRTDILEQLFDYVVETFYPAIININSNDKLTNEPIEKMSKDQNRSRDLKCRELFKEIVKRTATTCAGWQTVFFAHGVLNSDNMSIVGLTLDYGPYGFMEQMNQNYVCNASDHNGRYSFINQPTICRWNLFKLAEILVHFTSLDELVNTQEEYFLSTFKQVYYTKMRSKFGLFNELQSDINDVASDEKLVDTFLQTLECTGSDVTNGFRNLNLIKNVYEDHLIENQINNYIELMISQNSLSYEDMKKETTDVFDSMSIQYCLRLREESPENFKLLEKSSEKIKVFLDFIDRYEKTKGLSKEEKIDWDRAKWKEFFKMYLIRIKHDLKGESSNDSKVIEKRIALMNSSNPKFILRNHLVQKAIQHAENGNNDEINRLIKLIEQPYAENVITPNVNEDINYYYRMPTSKEQRCKSITCSS